LIQAGFPNLRHIEAIPLPVGAEWSPLTQSERREFRASLGLADSSKMIVYAGRLSVQKNPDLLLLGFKEILKRNPTARLFLLGDIDHLGFPHLGRPAKTDFPGRLTVMIERMALSEQVSFQGPVSQEKLRSYFGACDLHVSLTSHFGEDFGYSIAQGMACGAPTAVTKWGGGLDFSDSGAAMGLPMTSLRGLPLADLDQSLPLLEGMLANNARIPWRKKSLTFAKDQLRGPAVRARWLDLISRMEKDRARPASPLRLSRQAHVFLTRRHRAIALRSETPLFRSTSDPHYLRVLKSYFG